MRFNELLGGAVTDVTAGGVRRRSRPSCAVSLRGSQTAIRACTAPQDVRVLAPPDVSLIEVEPRRARRGAAGLHRRQTCSKRCRRCAPGWRWAHLRWPGADSHPAAPRGIDSAANLARSAAALRGGRPGSARRTSPTLRTVEAPSLVNHRDGERRLMVGFNVRGADLGQSWSRGAGARCAAPCGCRRAIGCVWGGQYENLAGRDAPAGAGRPGGDGADPRGALRGLPAGLRPALDHLHATCRSPAWAAWWRSPSRGMPISISAAIGFIALVGGRGA